MTARCPDTTKLRALLDGSLQGTEQANLQAHLESCPACQLALEAQVADRDSWDAAARQLGEGLAREPALSEAIASLKQEASPTESADNPVELNLDFLSPPEKPDQLGRLGHYEIVETVGRGGFGIVFKAFDRILHRVVAIKVLSPARANSATARQRFTREARAAAAVSHDHVVTIHAVEEVNGLPYLVMQYVAGMSLQQRLGRADPLEVKEILRIGLQAASGLAAAHAQGLVHRDVKPANILLENGVQRVKLTDFGLARAVDDATLTQSGVVAGTPQYMSPEQALGETVDHRADLFSLGSVLYVLCTGKLPFRAGTSLATLRRVCEEEPQPIREINPDIPEWLCDVIGRLHAKRPADRLQSAREVADLLGRYLAHLQEPGQLPTPPLPRRRKPSPPSSSSRVLLWVLLAIVGAFLTCTVIPLGSLVMYWTHGSRDVPQQQGIVEERLGPNLDGEGDARLVQEKWSNKVGRPTIMTNTLGMKLVLIPPGEFDMGASAAEVEQLTRPGAVPKAWFFHSWIAQRVQAETPRHRVRLTRPFYLGVHEVTVGQFRQFVEESKHPTDADKDPRGGFGWGNGRWEQRREFTWRTPGFPQTDEQPVVNASWDDAIAFCRWLSAKEKVAYRVPTEAEWEYACRAGTRTRYTSGEDDETLPTLANVADDSLRMLHPGVEWAAPWNDGHPFTAPVGRFQPNAWGLHDMHGNACEWCADWYDEGYYQQSPAEDPPGAPHGRQRVFRGGSWDNPPLFCRSADRYSSHSAKLRSAWAGFRVVREP